MTQVTIPAGMLFDLHCPKCDSLYFYPVFALKHYPGGLHSLQPLTIPVQHFRCINCSEIFDSNSILKPVKK